MRRLIDDYRHVDARSCVVLERSIMQEVEGVPVPPGIFCYRRLWTFCSRDDAINALEQWLLDDRTARFAGVAGGKGD